MIWNDRIMVYFQMDKERPFLFFLLLNAEGWATVEYGSEWALLHGVGFASTGLLSTIFRIASRSRFSSYASADSILCWSISWKKGFPFFGEAVLWSRTWPLNEPEFVFSWAGIFSLVLFFEIEILRSFVWYEDLDFWRFFEFNLKWSLRFGL